VDGTEPHVCGGKKFLAGMRIMRAEKETVFVNDISFDEIAGGFTYKDIAVKFWWQGCAAIDEGGTGSCKLF
jgi:hypothetical protein